MVTLKKSTFLWIFLEQSALLPQKLKLFLTFCHYHVKAEGRSIPKHPDIINTIAGGRNYCRNLDNAVSLPPKIAPFTPFLNTKPFSPTWPSEPSWSSSCDVCLFLCIFVCPVPMRFFCVIGLVQSVPRPWTGAILILIPSRALKTKRCSGVRSRSSSWVEP